MKKKNKRENALNDVNVNVHGYLKFNVTKVIKTEVRVVLRKMQNCRAPKVRLVYCV